MEKIYTLVEPPDFSAFCAGLKFSFPCPQCGHEFDKTLGWFESNDDIACPGCEARIGFEADEIRNVLPQLRDALYVLWTRVNFPA